MASRVWSRVTMVAGAFAIGVGAVSFGGIAVAAAPPTQPPSRVDPPAAAPSGDDAADRAAPGEYVVTLRPSSGDTSQRGVVASDLSSRIGAVMSRLDDIVGRGGDAGGKAVSDDGAIIAELPIIDGFGARLSDIEVAMLRSFDDVLSVEANRRFELTASPSVSAAAGPDELPWGLDRIDQPRLPLNGVFKAPSDGAGVTAYVIDDGVWSAHREFAGRIDEPMIDYVGEFPSPEEIEPACLAHGTHVAGTIAGTNVGVAPKARVQALRVFDCAGSAYGIDILRAMNWVAENAQLPAVVNMSLGGGYDPAISSAVRYLTARGITVVVAAGNGFADACGISPASEPTAITVGASDIDDTTAFFSNYGPCVDLYAPGFEVLSAGVDGPGRYALDSGTSMASPHVAGTAAVYLSSHPTATPAAVERAIVNGATRGVLRELEPNTPNRLLQVNGLPDPIDRPSTDPVAHIAPPSGTGALTAGRPLTLDGGGSFDPAGGALSYEWRVQGVTGVAGTASTVTVTPTQFGRFEVALKVTNRSGVSTTASLAMEVFTAPPVVVLDPPEAEVRALPGDLLSWDASGSYDPDGGDLRYAWSFEDGLITGDADGPKLSLTFTGRPTRVNLAVVNQYGFGVLTTIFVRSAATPVAVIDPSSVEVSVGEPVVFDGSGSHTDPDVDEKLTYEWRDNPDGFPVSSDSLYRRTFDKPGTYSVYLRVATAFYETSTAKATVVVSPQPAAMSALEPVRVLDTRSSSPDVPGPKGSLGAGGVARFTVGDIPLTASGVVLNVTAVNPRGDGHLTVYPCGDRPGTSNVNYRAGVTTANAVVSLLGGQHELCVWSYAPADVVVDVTGYVRADSPAHSIEAVRAIDTRAGLGEDSGRVAAGGVVKVPVSSASKVPADAAAVFLNVTAVDPAADGHLAVYPCGPAPETSNVNYRAGVTKANMAVVTLAKDGSVCVKSHADTDVVVDILGYVDAGRWVALNSMRKLDTRSLGASQGRAGPLTGGSMVKVKLGVNPATVDGVFLTVAAVNPSGDGHLTVFPCGDPPVASTLNYRAGVTTSNMVFSEVDQTGSVCVWTHASTDIVVDFNGSVTTPR